MRCSGARHRSGFAHDCLRCRMVLPGRWRARHMKITTALITLALSLALTTAFAEEFSMARSGANRLAILTDGVRHDCDDAFLDLGEVACLTLDYYSVPLARRSLNAIARQHDTVAAWAGPWRTRAAQVDTGEMSDRLMVLDGWPFHLYLIEFGRDTLIVVINAGP